MSVDVEGDCGGFTASEVEGVPVADKEGARRDVAPASAEDGKVVDFWDALL